MNNCVHANVITCALQRLGFYAEIADCELDFFGCPCSAVLTNANENEFLILFQSQDEHGDREDYREKYDPVTYDIFDRYTDGRWCHPSVSVMEEFDNMVFCGFPSDRFVQVKVNQPPKYNSDKVICFYSKGDYPQFSNFHLAKMASYVYRDNEDVVDKEYVSVEHYFQIMKALEFDPNGETLKQMGNHLTCAQIKSLGRKVQNFNPAVWNIRRRFHMRDAVAMKFWQNDDLRELLLSTGNAILAEASPRDTFWGIGYSGSNPKAHDPAQWRGRNVLGNMLMYLRDEMREEQEG